MNEFQTELKNSLERFRLDHIEPHAEHDDAEENFRMDVFRGLGELGVCGMTVDENYGGLGLGYTDLCIALEEIAKSSVSYAVTVSVSLMVQGIIQKFGNEEQKKKYLPDLTSGQEIGAFCLSESSSGSDAKSLKTTAKKVEGGYILNGAKMWITSGGIAKTYVVMARTGEEGAKGVSAFIVQDGTEGLSFGKKEKKMGWKVSPTREVLFQNCFVPEENLLLGEGQGFKVALGGLDAGRITIGSIAVGLSDRAVSESVKYSLERQQFDQPIFDFQGLQFMISDMACEMEASRLLVMKAAELLDAGKINSKL